MAQSKIGFLASGGGGNPTGIGTYVSSLADAGIKPVIMCNDGDVGISQAIATGKEFVAVARVVKDATEQWSVPNYGLTPYEAAVAHWNKIKPEFHPTWVQHKDKIWIQPINEVDKEKSSWLGYFAIEIAMLANAEGYKVAMFGWSSGEPEPEHWRTPGMLAYLAYCETYPSEAGIALHEYDFAMGGMENVYPYHVGRFQELFSACLEHNISRPLVFITEWGWAYNDIPAHEQCMADVAFASELYAMYPEIQGAGMWYLGPGFNNIADKVQQLISPVTTYALNTTFPDPDPEPNALLNPSFELGWYHPETYPGSGIPVQELQIPNYWEFWYADESMPNPYDPNPWSVWRRPEVRTLPESALPPSEQGLFVLDGNYTLKVFKGYGSIYYAMSQPVPKGKWKLEVKVYPDLIVGYNQDGTKIFTDDPDACIIWVDHDFATLDEVRPVPGAWNMLEFILDLEEASMVNIYFMQPFAIPNNGIFADNWRLIDVSENCNAREDGYHRVVWVPDQSMTKTKYLELCGKAYDEGKITVGFSYDDAGIGCGLKSKTAVLYNIPANQQQVYLDWYNLHYPGTQVEFRNFP